MIIIISTKMFSLECHYHNQPPIASDAQIAFEAGF